MKPIIEVRHVSKRYKVGVKRERYLSLRDSISSLGSSFFKKQDNFFWALDDVNFDVMPGECLGIIGGNGAGKSTLLKILSQITPPTKGEIKMRGRVASLLEVGTGFHPELTGKENIYLNGSILGMSRKEINHSFDEIVDFSGIEKFLDTPLKHYSSGMQLRLAFSVAAHLNPEILLIDEVLAVGDSEFQKKCLGKMDEVSKSGRTVIFVSHDLGAIRSLCTKSILLSNGSSNQKMDTAQQIQFYSNQFDSNKRMFFGKDALLKEISIINSHEENINNLIFCGDRIGIKIKLNIPNDIIVKSIEIGLPLYDLNGRFITLFSNKMSGYAIQKRTDCLICWIDKMPIMCGQFYFDCKIIVNDLINQRISNVISFNVMEGDFFKSNINYAFGRHGINIKQSWQIK